MPRKARELSARAVAAIKTDGWHAVGGVDGLCLQVRGESSRSWVLRASVHGKRRVIGLGSYADLSLADARRIARQMRVTIAEGGDPLAERRARRSAARDALFVLTFDEAAKRFMASRSSEWKNPKHRAQWRNTLATYASPVIGKMPVDAIEMRHVESVLAPIWAEKNETASRLRGRIESVLGWAIAGGLRSEPNPARWRDNLEHRLAKPSKVKKVRNHPALPAQDMYRFMCDLRAQQVLSARALEFLILTATRSNEIRGARWDEIDLDRAVWRLSPERMKADRGHRVLLSTRAVALLESLPRHASGLLFPGNRGEEMSDATLAALIRRMHEADLERGGAGYLDPHQLDKKGKPRVAVPHGFRSTFRDWVGELTAYPGDMAEMALAHKIDDKTEAAYRRGDMLAKRVHMMEDWSKFIDTPPATGNVVALRKTAG